MRNIIITMRRPEKLPQVAHAAPINPMPMMLQALRRYGFSSGRESRCSAGPLSRGVRYDLRRRMKGHLRSRQPLRDRTRYWWDQKDIDRRAVGDLFRRPHWPVEQRRAAAAWVLIDKELDVVGELPEQPHRRDGCAE